MICTVLHLLYIVIHKIMAEPKERTFLMIKPDGVQRGLVGNIIKRFEDKGFKLVAMKFVWVSFCVSFLEKKSGCCRMVSSVPAYEISGKLLVGITYSTVLGHLNLETSECPLFHIDYELFPAERQFYCLNNYLTTCKLLTEMGIVAF